MRAARVAMELYFGLADRADLIQVHSVATSRELHPTDGDRARADYLMVSFDFQLWSMFKDEAVRRKAVLALTRFHDAHRGQASAAYVLEAAYRVAKMKQATHDPTLRAWLETTLADWKAFATHPPQPTTNAAHSPSADDSPYADYRDEAALAIEQSQVVGPRPERPGIIEGVEPAGLPAPPPP